MTSRNGAAGAAPFRATPATPVAVRAARVLLALHCAGERGVELQRLVELVGTSRASLYRDLERIRQAGWRIQVERPPQTREQFGESRATYSIGPWQRLPRPA